ncbi:follicle-stimulating hormone receptor-like protein, partial [Euroglyphus maynei]
VYLFIIAIVDLRTQGVYFNYAIDWQHGIGCKIAGFITVFAQLLSIFTLTVITLERLFAITYAIQLNRRLKLNLAVKVMIAGWLIVILLASLPLFGISSYSKTSICLPMEHHSVADILYLLTLLVINQLAFIIICACYSKMYFSIISQKTRATINDMTIAKRMALLVFTDFACWAPIAFFGLTAIAGYPLIDVTKSKILLVTIYPLNSCANPFLYVIFTKQYRRDFFILSDSRKHQKQCRIVQHENNDFYVKYHNDGDQSIVNQCSQCSKCSQCQCMSNYYCQHCCSMVNMQSDHHHHNAHPNDVCGCSETDSIIKTDNHQCNNDKERQRQITAATTTTNVIQQHHQINNVQQDFHSDTNKKSINDRKHRKHKRCHHYQYQHCRNHHQSLSNQGSSRNDSNDGNTLSNNEKESCSCAGRMMNANHMIEMENLSDNNNNNNNNDNHHHRQAMNSIDGNSCERIHIVRNNNHCQHHMMMNGRVLFSKHKDNPRHHNGGLVIQTSTMSKANKVKGNSIIANFLNSLSISKHLKRMATSIKSNESSTCALPEHESSESCSPYSSTNSLHRNHQQIMYRNKHCHHHRCYTCHTQYNRKPFNSIQSNDHIVINNEPSNPLPVEEQREILRQALQETTTIQEAVAVVEELSSGARISHGSSSNSSKKI